MQLGALHSSHCLPLYSNCRCLLFSLTRSHCRRLPRSDDFFLLSKGLMYFLTYFVNNAFRRYPDYAKIALYIAAGVYSGSLLLSSFATEVSRWFLCVLSFATCADTRRSALGLASHRTPGTTCWICRSDPIRAMFTLGDRLVLRKKGGCVGNHLRSASSLVDQSP